MMQRDLRNMNKNLGDKIKVGHILNIFRVT